jgi:hypothetical protein
MINNIVHLFRKSQKASETIRRNMSVDVERTIPPAAKERKKIAAARGKDSYPFDCRH